MRSRMMVVAGAVALAVVSLTLPVLGQGTILFRPTYTAGSFPTSGWDRAISEQFGVRWTRSFLATGGPFGGPAHRLTEIATPSAAGCGGQMGWGWDKNVEASDPPRSQKRYIRWAMRYTAASNFLSGDMDGCSGIAGPSSNKLLIVGQGCSTRNCRIILTDKVMPDDPANAQRRKAQFGLAIDGGTAQTESGYIFDTSGWLFLQLELTPSSSTSTTDGGWRLFVNNNSTPALVRTGIRLDPENWKYVAFGSYNNNTLKAGGRHEFDTALFEVGTAFDAGWYRTTASTPPPPSASAPAAVQGVRVVAP